MTENAETVTLWRPVGPAELDLIRASGMRDFLDRYEVQEAGGRAHREYWIPAEDLAAFNAAIVGEIEVTAEFR
jgi:hypothetical protein